MYPLSMYFNVFINTKAQNVNITTQKYIMFYTYRLNFLAQAFSTMPDVECV